MLTGRPETSVEHGRPTLANDGNVVKGEGQEGGETNLYPNTHIVAGGIRHAWDYRRARVTASMYDCALSRSTGAVMAGRIFRERPTMMPSADSSASLTLVGVLPPPRITGIIGDAF